MTIHLTRIDPDKNMARFYRLAVDRDLFGHWALTIEWGRIGQGGQLKRRLFADAASAGRALAAQAATKRRRGYSGSGDGSLAPSVNPSTLNWGGL